MFTLVVALAAGIGVAALVGGVALIFRGETPSAVEDRLKNLAVVHSSGPARDGMKEASLLAQSMADRPHFLETLFSRHFNLRLFLEQADCPLPLPKLALITVGLGVGSGLLCLAARLPFWVAPLVGGFLSTFPLMWLVFRRRSRLSKFGKQLPEALELLSRALRAGHSLGAGFHLVAEEMNDPIGREFGRCYDEQNLGVPLEESLQALAERVPNMDLRFFATAVILQRTTGGDLAEILDKIGYIVRERFKIFGQVQALTGEGRLSGIVLLALPPVLFLVMLRLNYNYVMMLFNDPMGQQMLFGGIVMQLLGAVVIKKIITIKV